VPINLHLIFTFNSVEINFTIKQKITRWRSNQILNQSFEFRISKHTLKSRALLSSRNESLELMRYNSDVKMNWSALLYVCIAKKSRKYSESIKKQNSWFENCVHRENLNQSEKRRTKNSKDFQTFDCQLKDS
jgi:hypothetical protein